MAQDSRKEKLDQMRRELLFGVGALGAASVLPTPTERLLNLLAGAFIRQAQAAEAGLEGPRNYVNVMLQGAPSRYVFDHWVRTSDQDPALIANSMVATRYTSAGGQVTGVQYSTFSQNGILVPHMFSQTVFSGDGSQRPLTDLLNHMLVIRGYATGVDGHAFNAKVQQAPIGGVSSISGCAADESKKYFEAINWPDRGDWQTYASVTGKALNKIIGTTPLKTLLEGFAPPTQMGARNLRERNQASFDKAAAVLRSFASSDSFGAKALSINLDNALGLLKKGVQNVDGYWAGAVARYAAVIRNSMRASGLLGISDLPLVSDESPLWRVHSNGTSPIASKDFDFRNSITTLNPITNLAEAFALTEYILKEGLGTSIEVASTDMQGLTMMAQGTSNQQSIAAISDMHDTGAMASLLICTAYFRGLSAAILELSRQLGESKWSETVLQVMSDFGRVARTNASGADHGYNQMVTSVFSGAIQQGPFVVGNVLRQGASADYAGSQGLATSIDGYNQKGVPTPVMAASTVAALLNLHKNPFENVAAPLVKLQNGQLKVLYPAKMKDG